MRARVLLSSAAALSLVIVGCGGNAPTPTPGSASSTVAVGSPSSTPVITTTAPSTPNNEPSVPFADAPTTVQPADYGSDYEVVGVRVGSHDGYDRVVVELSGGDAASLYWWAEYDSNPVTQGKGDPVELDGDATLRVNVQGIAMPEPGDEMVRGLQADSGQGEVTGVYVDPMFEAMIQVFIGVEQRAGFHVSTLESPTRLVIDIQHP